MRAKGLWRIAPRMHTRTGPERAPATAPELIPPELQAKMVAAFERARAERLASQIQGNGARWASDPVTRSNTAAFLVLERERRVVAERLSRRYRRRRNRYRDLVLVTKLIQVEYEHLAGRAIESADPPPSNGDRSNGDPSGGDMAAAWARPWGSGPLIEMGAALAFYQGQRDQLGRRLPAPRRGGAAAAAAGHRDRILSRFEMAKGGRLGEEPLAPPPSDGRIWPWPGPRFAGSAAVVACACFAVGVGALLVESGGDGSTGLDRNPTPVVARVPDALITVGDRQPARRGDTSQAPKPDRSNEGADQAAVSAPPATPEPVAEPAPAPVAPAPVAAPAPAPAPQPEPNPPPDRNPGPVSSLPPPADNLPPPGRSGG